MRKILLLLITISLPVATPAHVNSPDVYYDGQAGPYHLLVIIKPPTVVPGVAQIQIRTADKDVTHIKVLPLKMVGAAATLEPAPDVMERSTGDPQLFSGKLWIMARGSWKVKIDIEGGRGNGELSVPLPSVSSNSASMQTTLAILLAVLGLILVAGLVAIVSAAGREAALPPGQEAVSAKRGHLREIIAAAVIIAGLVRGGFWWEEEASANARLNYKLPHVHAELQGGNSLRLNLENPNELPRNTQLLGFEPPDRIVLSDLFPDHGHLMHLFLVRMPDMKSFWHLHPQQIKDGRFVQSLPSLPAGRYRIYADIVHENGFPETQVGTIDVPSIQGETLSGDDSGAAEVGATDRIAQLSDGYRMVWQRDSDLIKSGKPYWLRFQVEDKNGKPVQDMEPYMGMAGHAAIISNDGAVFAHVHPAGSVSMAAVSLAEGAANDNQMAGMDHGAAGAEASFPYGFPKPGEYHIFVQVKRGGKVETGAFKATVK